MRMSFALWMFAGALTVDDVLLARNAELLTPIIHNSSSRPGKMTHLHRLPYEAEAEGSLEHVLSRKKRTRISKSRRLSTASAPTCNHCMSPEVLGWGTTGVILFWLSDIIDILNASMGQDTKRQRLGNHTLSRLLLLYTVLRFMVTPPKHSKTTQNTLAPILFCRLFYC